MLLFLVPAQVFALGIQMFKLSLSTGVWCVDVCVYRNTEIRCTVQKCVRTRVINYLYRYLSIKVVIFL